MSAGKVKATGQRGEWFATVKGERYPCIHEHWIRGGHHAAPNVNPATNPKDTQLVEALRAGMLAVETKDEVLGDGSGFIRKGYKALWRIENIRIDGDTLHFDLVERVANLK